MIYVHVDILRSPGAGSLITCGINSGSMLYVSPDNANDFEHDGMMKPGDMLWYSSTTMSLVLSAKTIP